MYNVEDGRSSIMHILVFLVIMYVFIVFE